MNKSQEKVLVAALCGLVVTAAAGFAVQPAMAAGYQLDVRKWPASYSQKIGALAPDTPVWVERCITVPKSADWCLVDRQNTRGWVNSRYLTLVDGWEI